MKQKFYAPTQISENMRETPEGFLLCLGVPIARTGSMKYDKSELPLEPDENGLITIFREDREVFRPETIASFEGKPFTITHPEEFVSPENWKHLAKGVVQNVRRGDGDFNDSLIADILVTDKIAIGLVKNGLREVSCGYEADYEQSEDGKAFQVNIIGNHLALVDKGRAGSSYAINDHKGKVSKMTLKDRIKAIYSKAQDEAMKVAEDAEAKMNPQDPATGKPAMPAHDASALDELKKAIGDVSTKLDAMMKPKDAEKPDDKKEKKKEEKTGDEPAVSMEDRMKTVEAAISKLLENTQKAGDEDKEDKVEDADEEESEDDDFEESTMTGDAAMRAEILCPGIAKTKNMKAESLKAAYKTKDGKKIIDSLTGGKPTFDSAEKVDTLFIAASELLKVSRKAENARTKQGTFDEGSGAPQVMTAERLNQINAEYYKRA